MREAVYAVQEVALVTNTSGKVAERIQPLLDRLQEEVRAVFADEESLPFRICPPNTLDQQAALEAWLAEEERIIKAVQEALRIHCIGFFRAYGNDMTGTIFDGTPPAASEALRHYIRELATIYLEHAVYFPGETGTAQKAAQRATQYHPSEVTREFMIGNAISERLHAEGIRLSDTEMENLFTLSLRLNLIWGSPKDPLQSAIRVAQNYLVLKDDSQLMAALLRAGISLADDELAKLFLPSVRLHLAYSYPHDPLNAAAHYVKSFCALTDQQVQQLLLQTAGVSLSTKACAQLVPWSLRKYLALTNTDPLAALKCWVQNGHVTLCSPLYGSFLERLKRLRQTGGESA